MKGLLASGQFFEQVGRTGIMAKANVMRIITLLHRIRLGNRSIFRTGNEASAILSIKIGKIRTILLLAGLKYRPIYRILNPWPNVHA